MKFDKELYWARRKMGFRGQGNYEQPTLVEGSAKAPLTRVPVGKDAADETKTLYEEVYLPRKTRRQIIRKFVSGARKGRIDLAELNKQRLELNRDRKESGK